MTRDEALARYARFYEEMTPERLDALRELCIEEVRFRDPFNDLTGVGTMIEMFRDMYSQVEAPSFEVTDRALGENAGYLRWTMRFRRNRRPWTIEGMSEIHFDDSGRVTAHLDHWDSGPQFYAKLPLIGAAVRWIQRKMAV
jgi:steroid delta-isomerase